MARITAAMVPERTVAPPHSRVRLGGARVRAQLPEATRLVWLLLLAVAALSGPSPIPFLAVPALFVVAYWAGVRDGRREMSAEMLRDELRRERRPT